MDVCSGKKIFPLRVIALQDEITELDDDVYNYVLEHPVVMKDALTHIQVAGEDGDIYSFIPQMSYGRDVGPGEIMKLEPA